MFGFTHRIPLFKNLYDPVIIWKEIPPMTSKLLVLLIYTCLCILWHEPFTCGARQVHLHLENGFIFQSIFILKFSVQYVSLETNLRLSDLYVH